MNPQAIMTPGGIADQFTRGLSGVAQAFAQRSAIDRQAQQDAFSQQRALENDRMAREAFARQQTWREQDIANQNREFGLRQQGDVRQQAIFDAKMAEANPEQFVNHPSLGGIARRGLEDRANAETLRQFNLGKSGMPLLGTPDAPVGSYVPENKQAHVAGYDVYNASQALARGKLAAGGATSAFDSGGRYDNLANQYIYAQLKDISNQVLDIDKAAQYTPEKLREKYDTHEMLRAEIKRRTGQELPALPPLVAQPSVQGAGAGQATPMRDDSHWK